MIRIDNTIENIHIKAAKVIVNMIYNSYMYDTDDSFAKMDEPYEKFNEFDLENGDTITIDSPSEITVIDQKNRINTDRLSQEYNKLLRPKHIRSSVTMGSVNPSAMTTDIMIGVTKPHIRICNAAPKIIRPLDQALYINMINFIPPLNTFDDHINNKFTMIIDEKTNRFTENKKYSGNFAPTVALHSCESYGWWCQSMHILQLIDSGNVDEAMRHRRLYHKTYKYQNIADVFKFTGSIDDLSNELKSNNIPYKTSNFASKMTILNFDVKRNQIISDKCSLCGLLMIGKYYIVQRASKHYHSCFTCFHTKISAQMRMPNIYKPVNIIVMDENISWEAAIDGFDFLTIDEKEMYNEYFKLLEKPKIQRALVAFRKNVYGTVIHYTTKNYMFYFAYNESHINELSTKKNVVHIIV